MVEVVSTFVAVGVVVVGVLRVLAATRRFGCRFPRVHFRLLSSSQGEPRERLGKVDGMNTRTC